MQAVIDAAPPSLYVAWGCRRCGYRGDIARTTVPVNHWTHEMYRQLFVDLRKKLVRVHLRQQGCVAALDDFWIERHVPHGKTVVGRV